MGKNSEGDGAGLRPRSKRPEGTIKVCQDCKVKLCDANWTPSQQKYKRYICSKCFTARQKRYSNASPERIALRNEKAKETKAAWSDERKAKEARNRYNNWLKRKYGIDLIVFEKMLLEQDNKCAICASSEPSGKGGFHVDHCHSEGHVRALLCSKCNMMLGMSGDSPLILRAAANYIENHSIEEEKIAA